MSSSPRIVRAAAIQIAPDFERPDGTLDRVCSAIDEAASKGAQLAVKKQMAESMLACSIVGAPDTVRDGLERFAAYSGADELMVVTAVFDPEARRRSYSLLAEIAGLPGVRRAG